MNYDIYRNFPRVIEMALRIKAGHPSEQNEPELL